MTWYVPGALGVKAPDVAVPPAIGRFSEDATGMPVHVGLFGP